MATANATPGPASSNHCWHSLQLHHHNNNTSSSSSQLLLSQRLSPPGCPARQTPACTARSTFGGTGRTCAAHPAWQLSNAAPPGGCPRPIEGKGGTRRQSRRAPAAGQVAVRPSAGDAQGSRWQTYRAAATATTHHGLAHEVGILLDRVLCLLQEPLLQRQRSTGTRRTHRSDAPTACWLRRAEATPQSAPLANHAAGTCSSDTGNGLESTCATPAAAYVALSVSDLTRAFVL